MGFIIKCVLVLLIFSFIVYVLKAITRLSYHVRGTIRDVNEIREKVSGRSSASAEMIRCQTCGAFVSARDAVTVSARNRSQAFCSSQCARAHIAK